MSATLKAQYQTRINAATAATKPMQLAMLRVIGEKLGCDMTNLNTVAPVAADAAAVGTSLLDLSYLAKALPTVAAGGDTANVTFPYAVRQGDVVYANDCGNTFLNAPHDIQVCVLPSTHMNYVSRLSNLQALYLAEDSFLPGGGSDSPSFVSGMSLTLSDGCKCIGLPYWLDSDLTGGVTYTIFDRNFETPIKKGDIPFADHSGSAAYMTLVALKKTGTNTYRLYFNGSGTGSNTARTFLYYIGLTYTPASKTFAITTARTQLFYANDQPITVLNSPNLDDDVMLFTYWTGTKFALVSVNLLTSAVFVYTNFSATGGIVRFAQVSVSDGVKRYLLASSSAAWLIREGVDTVDTLPAGLLAELTPATVSFICLNGNGLLISRQASKELKLVVFNGTATTVTIHTIFASQGGPQDAPILTGHVRNGDEFIFPNQLRFSWDGTVNAPSVLPTVSRRLSPITAKNGQSMYGVKCLALHAVSPDQTNYFMVAIRATAGCFAYTNSVPLFEVKAGAAAAASASAVVTPLLAVPSIGGLNLPHAPSAFGYRSLNGKGHSPYYHKAIAGTFGGNSVEDAMRAIQRTMDYAGFSNGRYPAVTGVRVYPNGGNIKGMVSANSQSMLGVIELGRKYSSLFSASTTATGFFDIKTNMPIVLFGINLTSYSDGDNL